ncbi:hypothetical protein T10_4652 [Trichinella papuae]|uniref:Uncharacterized protein n=1 Tax=Trichinella papuae TaxID=268474 RepID=A0A0V1LXR9_9BILA|nr:hypothetical protein T10_5143 [Trichinella papuae]KRZ64225.1 hypothetical protein T10_4652 [Trichinella papuae]
MEYVMMRRIMINKGIEVFINNTRRAETTFIRLIEK